MMTQTLATWTARQGRVTRGILWIVACIGPLFLFGFLVGYGVAIIKRGGPSNPIEAAIALPLAALAMVGCLLLLAALRRGQPAATPYERRYNRVILTLGAIGGLAGMGWAMLNLGRADEPENFNMTWLVDTAGFAPLSPAIAIGAVLFLVVSLSAAFAWYHRIIDDHEERGVLWGSTIGYYFMLLAVPCWLLLAAGGLLPTMTGAIALALVLASTVVQAAVWAWLKYR